MDDTTVGALNGASKELDACQRGGRLASADSGANRSITHLDGDRWLLTCPVCGQAARVDLHGHRVSVRCFAECTEAEVLAALDVDRVRRELNAPPTARADRATSQREAARRVTVQSFAAIRAERTRWLWERRIPLGTATLLVGREKLGKSTLTAELAAQLSRGVLTGDLHGTPVDTLIVTYEDSAARTIKPRLMAADADLSRVHRVSAQRDDASDLVTLPGDVERIGALAVETGARLIVVDPLSASLGADVDGHRDQDVRRALAPLVALAERLDLGLLCLAHLNKSQGGDALSRVLGSRGLTAAVRSVLTFGRALHTDEHSPERVLAHPASNLAPEAPSLAYRHEGREVHGEDGGIIPTNRLVLVGECETRAEELVAARSDNERTDTEAAADWLADELADGEWRQSRDIKARAKAAGHSERTLKRAKQSLGVEDRREGYPAVSEWRLPVGPTSTVPDGPTRACRAGPTDKNTALERNPVDLVSQLGRDSSFGPTKVKELLATPAEEAEIERLRRKGLLG